jgi:hypothetical protein
MISRRTAIITALLCANHSVSRLSSDEPRFEFTGGKIVKVVFGVADDAYVDVEHELAAAIARD